MNNWMAYAAKRRQGRAVCAAALALALCGSVQAQADVCQVTIGESRVDFGVFTRYQLQPAVDDGSTLSAGQRRLRLTVQCSRPMRLALGYSGEPGESGAFRFGAAGSLELWLENPQLDGGPVPLGLAMTPGGEPEKRSVAARFQPDRVIVIGAAGALAGGESFSADVLIEPRMSASAARTSGQTE